MDTPELPTWLNADFLATALQGGEKAVHQVSVTSFSATMAVAAGNNYTSRLYRVKVHYVVDKDERETSLIVKAPYTNGLMEDMTAEGNFYDKEPKIYKYLLPVFNVITHWEFGPTSYHSCVKNVLVLLDLKEQGFEVGDRYKQLDFPHCKESLQILAKFHAASVVCKHMNPELIEDVGKEVFYNDSDQFKKHFKPWLETTLKFVAGVISELELSKVLEDLILKKVETISESAIRLCKPKTTGLNVLNHGDLWVNNILFKYTTTGEIKELKFIDFQVGKYASPALDVLYFIWTSANEEVRESRLPELCEIYRIALNSTLEELNCEENLTIEELHKDIKDAVDWAILAVFNSLPMIVSDPEDVINVGDINPNDESSELDETYLKPYKGKTFRAMLPKITYQFLAWLDHYK